MTISQAEARRLKRRVRELEQTQRNQRNVWSKDYPGGTHILTMTVTSDYVKGAIKTAQRLSHTVVVKCFNGELLFYALPQAGEQKP